MANYPRLDKTGLTYLVQQLAIKILSLIVPTYVGTSTAWESMTTAEKDEYLVVIFDDDGDIGTAYDVPYNQTNVGAELDAIVNGSPKTKTAHTGRMGSSLDIYPTIAADTTMDNSIQQLLDNDVILYNYCDYVDDGISNLRTRVNTGTTTINISNSSTNNTGSTISSGTFFYYNNVLVIAKTDIANGATLTLNTNYEVVTAGGLNKLNGEVSTLKDALDDYIDCDLSNYTHQTFTFAFNQGQTYVNFDIFTIPENAKEVLVGFVVSGNLINFRKMYIGIQQVVIDFALNRISFIITKNKIHVSYAYMNAATTGEYHCWYK